MDMKEEGRKILELVALLEFLGGHLKRAVTRQRALFESAV